jgi:hypothetical protein
MFVRQLISLLSLWTSLAASQSAPFDPLQYVDQLIGSGKDGQSLFMVWNLMQAKLRKAMYLLERPSPMVWRRLLPILIQKTIKVDLSLMIAR